MGALLVWRFLTDRRLLEPKFCAAVRRQFQEGFSDSSKAAQKRHSQTAAIVSPHHWSTNAGNFALGRSSCYDTLKVNYEEAGELK